MACLIHLRWVLMTGWLLKEWRTRDLVSMSSLHWSKTVCMKTEKCLKKDSFYNEVKLTRQFGWLELWRVWTKSFTTKRAYSKICKLSSLCDRLSFLTRALFFNRFKFDFQRCRWLVKSQFSGIFSSAVQAWFWYS